METKKKKSARRKTCTMSPEKEPLAPVWRRALEFWCDRCGRNGLSIPFLAFIEAKSRKIKLDYDFLLMFIEEICAYNKPTSLMFCHSFSNYVCSTVISGYENKIKGSVVSDGMGVGLAHTCAMYHDHILRGLVLYKPVHMFGKSTWTKFSSDLLDSDEREMLIILGVIKK